MSWLPLLAVAAVAFALALIPTRRLALAGWRPAWLAAYLVVLLAVALLAVELRAGLRVLVPILIVLYVAPFIGAGYVVTRAVARLGAGRGGAGARVIVEGTARPADEPSAEPRGDASAPQEAAPTGAGPHEAPGAPSSGEAGTPSGDDPGEGP